MEEDKYNGLSEEVWKICQAAAAYRENNPIHLGRGEDFIPKLSTDSKNEEKPRLTTKVSD